MSPARNLLIETIGAGAPLLGISDHDDLRRCGVGSGDIIRLVLLVEERFGLEVAADDLDRLTSIAAFDDFVAGHPILEDTCG